MPVTTEDLKEIDRRLQALESGTVSVYIEAVDDDSIPIYAHVTDAGADLKASEDITLEPNETKVIQTGIKVAIPVGFEIQVRPRSGLSLKTSLRVPNSPGTIDSGYRDGVGVIMTNSDSQNQYHIKKGERIAQMVVSRVYQAVFERVDDIKSIEGDRGGGFGSTGV